MFRKVVLYRLQNLRNFKGKNIFVETIFRVLCIAGLLTAFIWPVAAVYLWISGEDGALWRFLFLRESIPSYSIAGESSHLPFKVSSTSLQLLVSPRWKKFTPDTRYQFISIGLDSLGLCSFYIRLPS